MSVTELPCAAPVSEDLLRQYAKVATSIVSDNLGRLAGAVGLLPYHRGGHLVGTALTVRTRQGDNLAIHAALRMAREGDVIVIDGGGDISQALIGEIILAHAESIGVAGFVIDGAIRDVAAFRAGNTPCYARGVTHRGPYKNGPGALNVDVSIGGLVIHPGDLIIGDEDGIVALSSGLAAEILPGVRAQEEKERLKLEALRNGARLRAV